MFNPHAEPIANTPVYRRIGINDPVQVEPEEKSWVSVYGEAFEQAQRQVEIDRVWSLVVQAASGTNPPAQSEYQAPDEDAA